MLLEPQGSLVQQDDIAVFHHAEAALEQGVLLGEGGADIPSHLPEPVRR